MHGALLHVTGYMQAQPRALRQPLCMYACQSTFSHNTRITIKRFTHKQQP